MQHKKKEEKYYDRAGHRLVYIGTQATADFWDSHWDSESFETSLKKSTSQFVLRTTKRYLPTGSKVLEGGCGRGQYVYQLTNAGYPTTGVDYARKTVSLINELAPELDVIYGDVFALSDIADDTYDGYWSLGVIEHFYDGYEGIVKEMKRVVRPGGVLFLTVPGFSPIRRLKARLGYYPDWEMHEAEEKAQFYQFTLSPQSIIHNFSEAGFTLKQVTPMDGIKGLKDEVSFLRKPLQYLYNSSNLLVKVLKKILDFPLKYFFGHAYLYVFIKD